MATYTIFEFPSTTALATGDALIAQKASSTGTTVYVLATQVSTFVFTQTAAALLLVSGGTISSTGNFTLGAGTALATNATVGHVMVPSCAGPPSGTVVGATTGMIPMIVDTTNTRLYVFLPSGAWRYTTLSA